MRDRRRARGPDRRRRPAGRRRSWSRSAARSAPRAPRRSSCRRRWPSRGWTSASTAPARAPTRCARRVHPDHRRPGPAVLGLPRLPPRQARARARARPRRDHHAHADGQRLPDARASTASSTTWTWTRWSRSCATPSAATTPSRSPARAKYYEDIGYPGHVNCTRQLQRALDALRHRRAQGLAGAQLLLQHGLRPRHHPDRRRALVAPRRLRAAAGDDRPGLRLVGVPGRHRPRQRLGDHRRPRARLLAREPLLDGHRPPRHPGGRARADPGDGASTRAPRALTESFVEYRGYWLPHCFNNEGAIAEYWACREKAVVMDLSPLRKWEVLGPDAETLIQHAVTRDVRKLAVGQVVYTAVCNETGGMIDDATVFRLGRRQLPLRRRRPLRRRVADGAGRALGLKALGQALDRPAAQPRGAGPEQPRDPGASSSGRRRRSRRSTS